MPFMMYRMFVVYSISFMMYSMPFMTYRHVLYDCLLYTRPYDIRNACCIYAYSSSLGVTSLTHMHRHPSVTAY